MIIRKHFVMGLKMISKVSKKSLRKDSKGATAIEYALIASLIAVVAIAGMKVVGNKILGQLNNIASNIDAAAAEQAAQS